MAGSRRAGHEWTRAYCALTPNRNPTPASRERDQIRTTASEWFKSGGQDFSLVCDFADLPAEAVQSHVFERLATPAEQHSRSLRQVVWRAPEKAGGHSLANAD